MRVTKLMGMAVVLVALAATINALAFTTATVKNPVSITVQATGNATLAVAKVPTADPGAGVSDAGGYLSISIADQPQPNSTYEFGPVFTLLNRSTTGQTIKVTSEWDTALPEGLTIDLCSDTLGCLSSATPITIPASPSAPAEFKLTVTVGTNYVGTLGEGVSRTLKLVGSTQP